MATNLYFNNFFASQEQQLVEDLVVEAIKIHGLDIYYMPRTVHNRDEIWREGTSYDFTSAFELEMYIRDVNGFTGDGKFLSKFGLEIRDEITFQVSMRSFNNEIGQFVQQTRPKEGDLIYLPLNKKCFQIKFVDHEDIFYQLGALQMWSLVCELFEYSNETFNTGLTFIDNLFAPISENMNDWQLITPEGFFLTGPDIGHLIRAEYGDGVDRIDPDAMNQEIQTEADQIINFSEHDPFSEGGIY